MKVLLYMAMSVNGMIADVNNSEDFLSHYNWQVFCQLAKEYGCFIWGRKTYELVTKWDPKFFTDEIKNAKKVIVSAQSDLKLQDGYAQANSPQEALALLQKDSFATVILTGGGALNSSFAKENLIDEVLFNMEGVLVGQGIPVFNPQDFQLNLKLLSVDKFEESGVTLRYKVIKDELEH